MYREILRQTISAINSNKRKIIKTSHEKMLPRGPHLNCALKGNSGFNRAVYIAYFLKICLRGDYLPFALSHTLSTRLPKLCVWGHWHLWTISAGLPCSLCMSRVSPERHWQGFQFPREPSLPGSGWQHLLPFLKATAPAGCLLTDSYGFQWVPPSGPGVTITVYVLTARIRLNSLHVSIAETCVSCQE